MFKLWLKLTAAHLVLLGALVEAPSSWKWIAENVHAMFFVTNHFVLSSATGTGTGVDWTNAFTDLPASLTCGDIYYVAGGSYGKHVFNDGCVVVTEIRAATIADHGTATGWSNGLQGKATWTATGTPTGNGCVVEFQSSHYLFDGNGTRGADHQSGFLMMISNSNKVATVGTSCIGVSAGGTVGAGTWVQDITLDYVEEDGEHNTTDASCTGGTNCVNVFVSWCGSVFTLSHSWIHDGGNVLIFVKGKHDSLASAGTSLCNASSTGAKVTITQNYFNSNYSSTNQHGEGSECDEGAYCAWTFNVFRDMTGTAFIATPSGCGRLTCNIDNQWDIYGNVFELVNSRTLNGVACGVGGIIQVFDAKFSGTLNFYNNSIYQVSTSICANNASGSSLVFPGAEVDFAAAVDIENNLWDKSDNFTAQTICPNPPNTCASTWTWKNSTYANGQSSGGDTNAQTLAGTLFVNAASGNFHLTSDTAAWSSLGSPFNTDPDGVTRTSSRGAFQFVASGGTNLGGQLQNGTLKNATVK